MKNLKNRLRENFKRVLTFGLGIIFFGLAYSAWDGTKTPADILTADDWNGLVANIGWRVNGDVTNLNNASGKVGIGTINPAEKLDVVGNIKASGTVCDSTGCIGSGESSLWIESGSDVYRDSGNVGIGATNPQAKLEVNGNIIAADPTVSNHVATKAYVDASGGSVAEVCTTKTASYHTTGWQMQKTVDCDTPAERRWGGCSITGSSNVYHWNITKNFPNQWHGWFCEIGSNGSSAYSDGVYVVAYIVCCK